jgi:nucleotide-binding universal stress UspA family protein
MRGVPLAPGLVTLLLGGVAASVAAQGPSTVTLVPQSSTPYIHPFSTCRDRPPDDPAARAFFDSLQNDRAYAAFLEQLESLRAQPAANLSAAEAETYFLLLLQVGFRLSADASDADGDAVVLAGREHGLDIAARFGDDSFVRCAWLLSENFVMNYYRFEDRFRDSERVAAREAYLAFLESALAGEVRTETSPSRLHSAVGEMYLDKGFDVLPRTDRAAPLFETGARHLLDAAASAPDYRYLNDYTRYLFMLEKLPLRKQREITQRLLEHVETSWGGKPELTTKELEVYAHILAVAGGSALSAREGSAAVAIFERNVRAQLALRQRDPLDANAEVGAALTYLNLGDSYALLRDTAAAARAYEEAQRVFESASATARDMLDFQEFSVGVAARRESLR